MTPVRVLVTGAGGFVGMHVLAALADSDWELYGLTSSGPRDGSSVAGMRWREVDLLSQKAVGELLAELRPSHLLHLAWPGNYQTVGPQQNSRWVQASEGLLRAFAESGGRRAVFCGSCAEYDWSSSGPDGVLSETAPLEGDSAYAAAKIELFRSFEEYSRSTGLSAAWARIFFVYGPFEPRRKLVSSVVTSLLADRPAKTSHGLQVRDFVYVRDVAEALIAILDSDLEGAVNVGSGTGVRLCDIVSEIGSALKRRDLLEIGSVPARAHHGDPVIADITRLEKELQWQPRFDLEEGLAETIEWWRGRRR